MGTFAKMRRVVAVFGTQQFLARLSQPEQGQSFWPTGRTRATGSWRASATSKRARLLCQEACPTCWPASADPKLLDIGVDDRSLLLRAVYRDDVATMLRFLERAGGVDVVIGPNGETPLAVACSEGSSAVVEELLKSKADPNAIDADGSTCLALACSHGQLDIVDLLMKDGSTDASIRDKHGFTALHKAIQNRYQHLVHSLLSYRVNPNTAAPGSGQLKVERPVHMVLRPLTMQQPQNAAIRAGMLDSLLGFGANAKAKDGDGDTPLHLCARQGDLWGLWALFGRVPDANQAAFVSNRRGVTVMDEAASWGIDAVIVAHAARFLAPVRRILEDYWVPLTFAFNLMFTCFLWTRFLQYRSFIKGA